MQSYVSNNLAAQVTSWLQKNVSPTGSAVMVDESLTISGAAADAQAVGSKFELFSTFELLPGYSNLEQQLANKIIIINTNPQIDLNEARVCAVCDFGSSSQYHYFIRIIPKNQSFAYDIRFYFGSINKKMIETWGVYAFFNWENFNAQQDNYNMTYDLSHIQINTTIKDYSTNLGHLLRYNERVLNSLVESSFDKGVHRIQPYVKHPPSDLIIKKLSYCYCLTPGFDVTGWRLCVVYNTQQHPYTISLMEPNDNKVVILRLHGHNNAIVPVLYLLPDKSTNIILTFAIGWNWTEEDTTLLNQDNYNILQIELHNVDENKCLLKKYLMNQYNATTKNDNIQDNVKINNQIRDTLLQSNIITQNNIATLSPQYDVASRYLNPTGLWSEQSSQVYHVVEYKLEKNKQYNIYAPKYYFNLGLFIAIALYRNTDPDLSLDEPPLQILKWTPDGKTVVLNEYIIPDIDCYVRISYHKHNLNNPYPTPIVREINSFNVNSQIANYPKTENILISKLNPNYSYTPVKKTQGPTAGFLSAKGAPGGSDSNGQYYYNTYTLKNNTKYVIYGQAKWNLQADYPGVSFEGNSTPKTYEKIIMCNENMSGEYHVEFTPKDDGKLYISYVTGKGELQVATSSELKNIVLNKDTNAVNERIAFVGDSVTWGDGLLSEGYISVIEKYVYDNYGQTFWDNVIKNGAYVTIRNKKFYNGAALELSGVNSSVEFDMKSDKMILYFALPRHNDNCSIIDVYINDELYDEFSSFNTAPIGHTTKDFTGDGKNISFDLGQCFTYNPSVTVDGTVKKGGLNVAGYGVNAVKPGDDYVILRKIIDNKVHHVLRFATAPTGNIKCTFDYGESISYTKSTVGEIGKDFTSRLESFYGDGEVAFDPAKATSFSSGLDFRQVDERARKVYQFSTNANRHFKIVIKSLDPRAKSDQQPKFIFNMATNNDFCYMNAGIGGYTYNLFNTNTAQTSYKKFMEYEPKKITIMCGTNDDWSTAEYPITQTRQFTDKTSVINENSAYWIPTLNTDSVVDRWVDIEAFDDYSITLSNQVTNAPSLTVEKDDIIIINKYGNDERYCQIRVITSAENKKINFAIPIDTSKLSKENTKVFIKKWKKLGTQIDTLLNHIAEYTNINPEIYICSMGVPNFYARLLLGIKEYLQTKAKEHKVNFIDLYKPTSQFEASVKRTYKKTITAIQDATTYQIDTNINPLLRNVRVMVDNQDIFDGYNVSLCGSYGYYWKTNGEHKQEYRVTPTKLKLKTPIEAGKQITIEGSTECWSGDYTHMGNASGMHLYGTEIARKILENK